MNRIWIKLYLEILDDPKMGRLPNHLWRRAIELFLLAGRNGNDGLLPPVEEMAWTLRSSDDEVVKGLMSLAEIGVVHETPQGWVVTHFKERQYSESMERTRRYRERHGDGNSDGVRDAGSDEYVAGASSTSSLKSLEGGGMGEGNIVPVPETPKQAMEHPDIIAFNQVCGRIPGQGNYAVVIETIQLLRKQHGVELVDFLRPYWLAWSTRKNKDGKPYNPNSIVWLCEWAVQGEIPAANGHEPKGSWSPVPGIEQTRKMLEEKEQLNKRASKPVSIKDVVGRMARK